MDMQSNGEPGTIYPEDKAEEHSFIKETLFWEGMLHTESIGTDWELEMQWFFIGWVVIVSLAELLPG